MAVYAAASTVRGWADRPWFFLTAGRSPVFSGFKRTFTGLRLLSGSDRITRTSDGVVHLHNQPDCGGGPSRDLGRLAKVAGRIGYAARWRGRGADRSSLICRALDDAGADRVLTGTLAADCRIFSLIVDTPDTGRAPGVLGSEPCSDWLPPTPAMPARASSSNTSTGGLADR